MLIEAIFFKAPHMNNKGIIKKVLNLFTFTWAIPKQTTFDVKFVKLFFLKVIAAKLA